MNTQDYKTSYLKAPTAIICLSPNSGGMELATIKLAKTLHQYIDVTLIVQHDKFMHKQSLNNVDYSHLHLETISFSANLSLSIIFKARAIIKQKNIKNVIFVGASELKSLYFAFLGLDINLIVRHGTTKSNPKKDFFHKLIYSNVATHVAISRHLSKNVSFIVPFGKNTKLTTIIPSMPKECSTKKREEHEEIKLLHTGRVTPGKGLKEALLSCSVLYENNIKFTLDSYGGMSPEYKSEFENFIASLIFKDSFNLCGFSDNIYDEYQTHDIFIFPTKGEGFGNVMMEAIAHGMIIVSFNNTAITNFKEMGFHIHLAEDGSVDELKEKLLFIANNLQEEKRLAKQNIEKAKIDFSAKREAAQYLELLV